MKISVGRVVFFLGCVLSAGTLSAQSCACGANPPGPPPNREQHPYANAPEDMRPFSKFTVPYYENYGKLVEYNGSARDVPTVKAEEVDEVRIGFLGPVENHPDKRLGNAMLHGAQLAIDHNLDLPIEVSFRERRQLGALRRRERHLQARVSGRPDDGLRDVARRQRKGGGVRCLRV